MPRILNLLCFALVGCASVSPAQPIVENRMPAKPPLPKVQQSTPFSMYINQRFGFKLVYPVDLRAGRQPDNGAGMTFTSSDGEFSVTAQGHFLNDLTLDAMWAEEVSNAGSTVNYSLKRPSYFVVSGTRNGQEYYRKVFARDGNWVRFDIVYPANQRSRWDPVVEQIARDFIPFLDGDFDRVTRQPKP